MWDLIMFGLSAALVLLTWLLLRLCAALGE
jgi:hypothetical protein